MTNAHQTLRWFFTCYFNEYCDKDWKKTLAEFFAAESDDSVQEVLSALWQLERQKAGEAELETLLDSFGCAYLPPGDSESYRKWLAALSLELNEAKKRKEEAAKPKPAPPPRPSRARTSRFYSYTSVGDVFTTTAIALLTAAVLYPVIGVGGCVTRVLMQGTPPHPSSPAHEVWLNDPVKSWTTEAVLIPLAFVLFMFLGSLANLRRTNMPAAIILLVLFLIAALCAGVWVYSLYAAGGRRIGTHHNRSVIFKREEAKDLRLLARGSTG